MMKFGVRARSASGCLSPSPAHGKEKHRASEREKERERGSRPGGSKPPPPLLLPQHRRQRGRKATRARGRVGYTFEYINVCNFASSCWSGRRPSCPVGIDRGDRQHRRRRRRSSGSRAVLESLRARGQEWKREEMMLARGRESKLSRAHTALIALISSIRKAARNMRDRSRLLFAAVEACRN